MIFLIYIHMQHNVYYFYDVIVCNAIKTSGKQKVSAYQTRHVCVKSFFIIIIEIIV